MKQILFLITAAAIALCGPAQNNFEPQRKLNFVEKVIENYYVDSVDANHLVEEAVKAMLKTLDPHSTYTNREETKALMEPLQGNFSGIGIQFQMLNDTLYVIQTTVGGPSEKVGLLAGDRILSANDTLISGVKMQTNEVMKHLRGPKGTIVNLMVLRKGTPEPIKFRVERDDIPLYSVSAFFMADPKTGYVKLTKFAETTTDEMRDAINSLIKQGMTQLIIDLEDNGGGYMKPACEIAEFFLDPDDLIVYTQGHRSDPVYYRSMNKGTRFNGKVVIMVNQYSASASEILSGALQDNDRAVIVGRRTFGKGLVQRPFPLPDGSMIRLTTQRYYTPSGRSIQKPYSEGKDKEYDMEIHSRYKAGELSSADSIHMPDSLRYSTLRLHRDVYGGGGIMPDVFVPVDTTFYTDYYRDLVANGIVNRYAVSFIDDNRKDLKRTYPTENAFIRQFEVSDEMMDGLVTLASKEGVEERPEQFAVSSEYLRTIVKALIGRDLFEQSTYYRIAGPLNPVFSEALRIVNDPTAYKKLLPSSEHE